MWYFPREAREKEMNLEAQIIVNTKSKKEKGQ